MKLNLLGSILIHADANSPVDLSMRKAEALLAYLAVEHQQAHSRDSLIDLFWPDVSTDKARLSLRVTLSRMKAAFEGVGAHFPLYVTRQTVGFVRNACWSDVAEFTQALHSSEEHGHSADVLCEHCRPMVAQAVSLYRDTFLSGLYLDKSPHFDDWLFMQRERFRVKVLGALDKLTAFHLRQGEAEDALSYARRQVEIDPLHEDAHLAVMQSYLALGRRADARRHYEICRAVLQQELGVEPSPAMRQLFDQMHNSPHVLAPAPQALPTPAMLHPIQSRLPIYFTPFIGRQDELAQLDTVLRSSNARLLTLVGAGGMGKTRLAVEIAAQSQDRYADGVYFVSFAAVQAPADAANAVVDVVVDTLANALGVTFRADERTPQVQLLDWLRPYAALLVLDNLEHLLACTPFLLEMLHAAPHLQLLVTSREPLGVQAENLIRLAGLSVPSSDDLEEVGRSPAVHLFVERSYRLDKRFRLHAENAADVARICRLLEGRPLGLELAATHTAHRTCKDVADAIRADLDFLTVALADVPARHRSLRAVFEQSWQALTPTEQSCLARLSLFLNPFRPEAAAAVAGASLVALTRLSNAHLIERHEDGERFQIHELLRQFAADKLARSLPDPTLLQGRYAEYFLSWLSQQDQILKGIQPRHCADTIQLVFDDVMAAWARASAAGRSDLLMRALPVLASFYTQRGMHNAAERTFGATLAQIPAEDEALRAHLLVRLGAVLERQGKLDAAAATLDQGVALAGQIDDQQAVAMGRMIQALLCRTTGSVIDSIKIARDVLATLPEAEYLDLRVGCLLFIATQETESGNFAASDAAYAEARRIVAQTGNKAQEQSLLFYYAADRIDDDEVAARQWIEQALALCPDTGDRTLETRILIALGFLQARIGNYAQAIDYHQRGLAMCVADHELIPQSYILHNLCADYYGIGDYEQAYRYGQEALEIAVRHDLLDGIAYAQMHLGHVLAEMQRYAEARHAFTIAKDTFLQMDRLINVVEVEAGLAHVERLMGNLSAALAHVDAVYPHLVPAPLAGLDEPTRVYLHCYQVLFACNDPRAQHLLETAFQYIQTRADRFEPADRERFLRAVPANREILAAWEWVTVVRSAWYVYQ